MCHNIVKNITFNFGLFVHQNYKTHKTHCTASRTDRRFSEHGDCDLCADSVYEDSIHAIKGARFRLRFIKLVEFSHF